MSRFSRSLCWLLLAALLTMLLPAPPAAAASLVFSRPTTAPVLDPFRLPDGPYGAGNRGIEYATEPGDRITAPASGTVSFSGAVAGSLFVSIDHPGGLRSTVGFVEHLLVRRGEKVERGDVVATAGGPFHFTIRLDGEYVDPEPLFGRRRTSVRLIPHGPASPAGGPVPQVALADVPDTLHDGPSGPRMAPQWGRRNHWVRATPGRLGVPHEHATGKEGNHGCHLDEAAARGRCPLRPPDPPLEPEDEAVHPR